MTTHGPPDEELSGRFGYAFDLAVTGMALLSLDGRYVRTNSAFRKLVGRTAAEVQEAGPAGVTFEGDTPDTDGLDRLLRGEAATLEFEKRYRGPGGRVARARVAVRRVDGDSGPLGFFVEAVDVTEITAVREELRATHERLRLVADAAEDVVLFRTRRVPELRHEFVSAGATHVTGYTPEEHYADPLLFISAAHPDDLPVIHASMASDAPEHEFAMRLVRPDGSVVWTEVRSRTIYDTDGTVVAAEGLVFVAADRAVEAAVEAGDARFRSLVQNASDVVLLVGTDGIVTYASPAVRGHFGREPEEVVGTPSLDLCHEEDRPALIAAFYRAGPGRSMPVEYRALHRDGTLRWMDAVVTNLVPDPNVGAYVLNSRDVTERRALTDELRRRAFTDELTRLPNRDGLRERIAALAGEDPEPFGVLRLSVGGLSAIVEVFGHVHADRLVVAVAERLAAVLPPSATLARTGPDDFTVVMPGSTGAQSATAVVQRLLSAFEAPFELDGEPFHLDGSVGLAVHPGHGRDPDALLRRAERARRAAAERGRAFVVYSSRLDDTSAQHVALLGRLRGAIEGGELELHYQPKVSLATRRVYGAEALLRWQHPEYGFVPPDRFIPLAERSGLIAPLTLWVLESAARRLYEWRNDGLDLSVAVNVTPRNLQDPTFPDAVAAVVETWGLPPGALWLEITERAVMTEPDAAVAACQRLTSLGVRLSLDDFGTGQSSFAYVASLPISEIKIDGSFVRDLGDGGANAGITNAIVGLAHHLGHGAVAEGVEDEATMERLAAAGCDSVQGYHVSRPLPPDRFLEWVRTSGWYAPAG